MKRLLVGIIVLAAIGGGVYLWLSLNAGRLLSEQVTRQADAFFTNPEALTVVASPIKLESWQRGTFAQVTISGEQLQLHNGPVLATVKIVLKNVTLSGPPYRYAAIEGGSYALSASDTEITNYLRTRGLKVGLARIPLDTATVTFSKASGVQVATAVELPVVKTRVPIKVQGVLLPATTPGKIDLTVTNVAVKKTKIDLAELTAAFQTLNPLIDLTGWPVQAPADNIMTTDGAIKITGKITGVKHSLLQ